MQAITTPPSLVKMAAVPGRNTTCFYASEIDLLAMKNLSALILICLFAAGVSGADSPKEADRAQQQLAALMKEVQGQQDAIAANQKKIDEKIAAIGEAIRLAKIYAGRGR
jgi:septal ring factor EnvC (AmiA/AmiB activator)